jgi:type IX secretion system PorP/SprF family membrane protein
MRMMKNLPLAIISIFWSTLVLGQQDFHFSQFFAAPITFNPANSGAFEGDFRAMTNYRSQFGSTGEPFKTIGFAADMPIKLTKDAFDKNFLGVGLYVVNDNAGIIGFNNLHIAGSASYAIDLGGTNTNPHYIALGLQVGYMQRSLDMNAASWERQWSGINFNPGVASGEQSSGTLTEGNINLGAGATWFKSFSEDVRLIAGAAMLNANAPKVNLLGEEDNLFRKYVFHSSMVINAPGGNIRYLPNVFVMFQGPNRIIDFGAEAEFALWDRTQFTDFRNNLSANFGAYYRLQDAIYFIGRINYHDFSLGISYDFTASQLSNTNNGQGGVELVLGYRTRFSGPGTGRQKLINSKGL